MVHFFRRLRQTFMQQNKARQYVFYALGEIVLVVIGILLALQINNWNEDQKLLKTEQMILTEMLKSLKNDLSRTTFIYNHRAKRKEKGIQTLRNYVNSNEKLPDSILYQSFWNMHMTLSFNYDKGAYESLKSHGLHLIQNDSLRQLIIRRYENDFPLGIIFIDHDAAIQTEKRSTYIDELSTYEYEQKDDGNWTGHTRIDFEKVKHSESLTKLIRLESTVVDNYLKRLEDKIEDFESLIAAIEKELVK